MHGGRADEFHVYFNILYIYYSHVRSVGYVCVVLDVPLRCTQRRSLDLSSAGAFEVHRTSPLTGKEQSYP